jgi:hypothetical protein
VSEIAAEIREQDVIAQTGPAARRCNAGSQFSTIWCLSFMKGLWREQAGTSGTGQLAFEG